MSAAPASETLTRLVRVAEAARALGVGVSTVYRMLQNGDLDSVKLPGATGRCYARRVLWESVERLLERSRVVPPAVTE